MIITDFEEHEELTAEERKDIFQRPSLPILFLRPQECLCIRGDRALRDC